MWNDSVRKEVVPTPSSKRAMKEEVISRFNLLRATHYATVVRQEESFPLEECSSIQPVMKQVYNCIMDAPKKPRTTAFTCIYVAVSRPYTASVEGNKRAQRRGRASFCLWSFQKIERYIDVRLKKSVCKCYAHEHVSARRGTYLQFSDKYLLR